MNYTKLRKALGLAGLKTLGVIFTLAAAAVLAPRSYAGVDQVANFYGQLATSGIKQGGTVALASQSGSAASTTTVILELFYEGPNTTANVTIGASSITFYTPAGTVDTSVGGTSYGTTGGTFDLAASSVATLGQLCDLINATPYYNCTLVGGIRSDASTSYLPNVVQVSGTNDLKAVGGYNVPTSTAALISLGIIPSANRHILLNYCTANSAGTPPIQVYGSLAKFGVGAQGFDYFGNVLTDSTLAWVSPALVANTTTNAPLATVVAQPWLEFGGGSASAYTYKTPPTGNAYNGHVVVRVNNYGLGAALQAATNFVQCNWFER